MGKCYVNELDNSAILVSTILGLGNWVTGGYGCTR